MKAAICYETGKPLVVEEVELVPPGKGEVKVRLAATAVCHSDVHDIKGELPGPLPFIPGHEVAGIVEEMLQRGLTPTVYPSVNRPDGRTLVSQVEAEAQRKGY